jgi:hypothetical protein
MFDKLIEVDIIQSSFSRAYGKRALSGWIFG